MKGTIDVYRLTKTNLCGDPGLSDKTTISYWSANGEPNPSAMRQYWRNLFCRSGISLPLKPDNLVLPYDEIPSELRTGLSKQEWDGLVRDSRRGTYWANIICPRGHADHANVGIRLRTLNDLMRQNYALTQTEDALIKNIMEGIRANRDLYDKSIKYIQLRKGGKAQNSPEILSLKINPTMGVLYVNEFPRRHDNLELYINTDDPKNWIFHWSNPQDPDRGLAEKEMYELYGKKWKVEKIDPNLFAKFLAFPK